MAFQAIMGPQTRCFEMRRVSGPCHRAGGHAGCPVPRHSAHGTPFEDRRRMVTVAASADDNHRTGMFGGIPLPLGGLFGGQTKTTSRSGNNATSTGEHATVEQAEQQARARSNSRSPSPARGNGVQYNNAPAASNGDPSQMISLAEVDQMLSGLKASLQSIQASRAEYQQLLQQRDQCINTLQRQLQEKDRVAAEMEQQLLLLQGQLDAPAPARAAPRMSPARQTTPSPGPKARAATPVRSRSPSPNNPARAAPTAEVVLQYRTGWKQAYLHCNMDGKGWTTAPGIPMEVTGNDMKQLRVPCSRLEFVLTNGKGDWDSPAGNYHINSPGNYKLESGRISKA